MKEIWYVQVLMYYFFWVIKIILISNLLIGGRNSIQKSIDSFNYLGLER